MARAILAALFLTAIWQVAEALLPVSFAEAFALIIFSGMIAYPTAAWLAMPRIPRKLLILAVASCLALYALTFLLTV
ncbi:hypothetical protein [Nonomuraea guangzhouensis]|uniref:Uncharacterized protein n=1 Tax=Nonomuraea guangzhouensis TaxID=1291555 RepID=A0ABW4GXC0_9ACTN|nr:hypothetical protein [Nonomuraea guangzhouensis]